MKLGGIVAPEMEYNHPDKGDALYAMELALSLEVRSVQSGCCVNQRFHLEQQQSSSSC